MCLPECDVAVITVTVITVKGSTVTLRNVCSMMAALTHCIGQSMPSYMASMSMQPGDDIDTNIHSNNNKQQ